MLTFQGHAAHVDTINLRSPSSTCAPSFPLTVQPTGLRGSPHPTAFGLSLGGLPLSSWGPPESGGLYAGSGEAAAKGMGPHSPGRAWPGRPPGREDRHKVIPNPWA